MKTLYIIVYYTKVFVVVHSFSYSVPYSVCRQSTRRLAIKEKENVASEKSFAIYVIKKIVPVRINNQ